MKNILAKIDQLQAEINQRRPPGPKTLKQLQAYYRVSFIYSSNALEGNHLTEADTGWIIEHGVNFPNNYSIGQLEIDQLEVVGLNKAYDAMYCAVREPNFTVATIKQFHKLFYDLISEQAGVYRTVPVIITGSKYPTTKPAQISGAMDEMVARLNIQRTQLHPVEFAALCHKELVFIHPFIDGNGRVARLLLNLVLLQAGYNIVIIPPVRRSEYMRSLELAHTNDHDFTVFIAENLAETQRDYLRLIG